MTMRRDRLERALASLDNFESPDAALEQYPTDPDVAAHLLHRAAMAGDIQGRTVIDLGAGTGTLAIGAALLGATRVIALERDLAAICIGRRNVAAIAPPVPVNWVVGDVNPAPLATSGATVVANPPFGAQADQAGADRPFLALAANCSRVSYTIHNEGSREFLEEYVATLGGGIDEAYAVELDLDHQFPFHVEDTRRIPAEAYRIRWDTDG